MTRFYSYSIFLIIAFTSFTSLHSQGIEDFENTAIADDTDSFTRGGITFTSTNTSFDWNTFVDAGAFSNGERSDRFFDNLGGTAGPYVISGSDIFTMQSIEFYLSSIASGDNPTGNPGAQLRVRGLLGGVEVFNSLKTTGFPIDFGDTNGYFLFDFTNAPGAGNVSSLNIDSIEFTLIGDFQYIGVDNFSFGAEVLNTDPPFVQSIAVVGDPFNRATSVSFQVNFNENANNITADDFELDNIGTSGTISNVSSTSGQSVTVVVDNITGEGSISIDLKASTDIQDNDGNGPAPSFTDGDRHNVSRCFTESFESFANGDEEFTSEGIPFTTGTPNFAIEFFDGAGVAEDATTTNSDYFLSNKTNQVANQTYSISTVGSENFTIDELYAYVSSEVNGENPTADGVLTFRGKLSGSVLYTITKNSNFPLDFDDVAGQFDNGYSLIDFATAGAADYSLTNIDELEIEISGAFIYMGIDGFKHCEAVASDSPPIVQSINLVGDPEANTSTVDYNIIFNENALNVSLDDFSLTTTGTSVGTISALSGSGNNYTVTINGISGEGSVRLDLNPGTDIEDEDGNFTPDPFTDGEVHLTSICNVETFETIVIGATDFTRDGNTFTTGTSTFSVEEFVGAGAGASDRFLSNDTDQGFNKTYQITVTSATDITMSTLGIYVSSLVDGTMPTDDGSITINGVKDNTTVYTITKSTGFPTSIGSTSGYSTIDFATDGASDFTGIDVDEIEIVTGGSFIYVAIDNFKFCVEPVVNYVWDANAWSPSDPSGGSTDIDTITIVDTNNPATLTANTIIGDVTVNTGTTLNLGSILLSVHGNIINNGTLEVANGTIGFQGTEIQTVSGTSGITVLSGFLDNPNGVTLNTTFSIVELLTLFTGTMTTNNNLVFKSNATRTGQFNTINSGTANLIGNATVERYIPARRAFRFLSSAVTTTTSIQANWQEGATGSLDNPNPGFGTHITGSDTGANGFDMTTTGNPSMFTLDNVAQTFQAIPNTNVDVLNAGTPYRTFVRGSRATDLTTNTPTADDTVLRAMGLLQIGDVTQENLSAVADEFNFIGNPYQSSVDMEAVLVNSTNLNTSQYYIWDPTLGERGHYVTVLLPAGTNTSGSAANQYLQPGQAAFVTTLANGTASVLFEEADKSPGNNTPTFDPSEDPILNSSHIIGQLFRAGSSEEGALLQDSFGILFSSDFTNDLTAQDAVKPINIDENMGIKNGDTTLSIERRAIPTSQDMIPLHITTYRSSDYILTLQVTSLSQTPAYLEDTLTGSFTALEEGENSVAFSINDDDTSSSPDRFRIVFLDGTLGTQDATIFEVSMYPNPIGNESLTITGNLTTIESINLQITNMLGQLVVAETLVQQNNRFSTTSTQALSKGLYFVTITSDAGSITKRIIKN